MPFTQEQRQIYTYFDGSVDIEGKFRPRRGDPVVLYRGLIEAAGGEGEFHELWLRAHATDRDGATTLNALIEQATLADVTRKAFGLVPFDPDGPAGLTEREMIDVLYDFNAWQKKSIASSAGSPSTSEPIPD